MRNVKWIFLVPALLAMVNPAAATVVSDFDDGTLQGWMTNITTGFTFTNPGSGGNPGGYAQLADTLPGGSGGFAVAPVAFLGDLTGYESVSWDALLPANPLKLVPLRLSSINTDWIYDPTGTAQVGMWQSWQAPLDGGAGWTRISGSETFAQVLANVSELAFVLEISTSMGNEAGLDNVSLNPVPVPAAVWLFGSGLLGLVGFARRRKS